MTAVLKFYIGRCQWDTWHGTNFNMSEFWHTWILAINSALSTCHSKSWLANANVTRDNWPNLAPSGGSMICDCETIWNGTVLLNHVILKSSHNLYSGWKHCICLQNSNKPHHQPKVYPSFTLEGPVFCPGKQNLWFMLGHYSITRICKPGTYMFHFFNIIFLTPLQQCTPSIRSSWVLLLRMLGG